MKQKKLKALRQIHLEKLEALKKTRYNNYVSNDF